MVDPGHVFRRAFSWLPSQFASQSDAPVGPRQFGSTEHLSTEAVAAFVDGELRMTAHLRAAHHLSLCPECAAEVDAQRQARAALRDSARSSYPAPFWACCPRSHTMLHRSRPTKRISRS